MSEEPKEIPSVPAPVAPASSNGGISIGGSVSGSAVSTGSHVTQSVSYQKVPLPSADTVDIKAELATLKGLLATLQFPDQKKVENALSDAETEAEKPEPDKAEVGGAVERALSYATKAEGFLKVAETIKPHITALAGWLGTHHEKLLQMVGLASGSQ